MSQLKRAVLAVPLLVAACSPDGPTAPSGTGNSTTESDDAVDDDSRADRTDDDAPSGEGTPTDPSPGNSADPMATSDVTPGEPAPEPDDSVVVDEGDTDLISDDPELVDQDLPRGCAENCSNDLRNVLSCSGDVVEECEDGDACLDGECVEDACAVADARRSSIGCDFWTIKPDAHIIASAFSCYAVLVANTWSVPVSIQVTRGDTMIEGTDFIRLPRGQGADLSFEPYDAATGLVPGDVAILFLAHQEHERIISALCPVEPAFTEPVGVYGSDRGIGFNIQTSEPISAYSVVPFGGGAGRTTSASLLLPTSRWGLEYVAVNAYAASELTTTVNVVGIDGLMTEVTPIRGVPSLNILAQQDDTEVALLPGVAIDGIRYLQAENSIEMAAEPGPIPASPAGEPFIFTLDRGEYVQISQHQELTGSPIISDKPVAVWGASTCISIPLATLACDAAHQQIPPVQALGNEYVGVRHKNRSAAPADEAPPWRLVGAVDGTELSWDPAAPDGAPATLAAGEVAEFTHTGPFVVESQGEDFPFYFAQYMTGAEDLADPDAEGGDPPPTEGDPEWVNVIPAAQYLRNYVFLTDPTYPETSLVVVRRPDADGAFHDITLECRGVLDGWQPIGDYEYTRIDLVTGQYESVDGCSNGIHQMSSDGAFGVTVWGWGSAATDPPSDHVSYAYPAGAGLRQVNTIALPPITAR